MNARGQTAKGSNSAEIKERKTCGAQTVWIFLSDQHRVDLKPPADATIFQRELFFKEARKKVGHKCGLVHFILGSFKIGIRLPFKTVKR